MTTTSSGGALEGIRVLDLSRILAGPFCSMLLADLGAEVWKIEHPVGGDDARSWGPPFTKDGESAYFLSINRNKKSIAVNLKTKEGVAIVQELATYADVLLENFLPGKLDKMGLGYDTLSTINPRLIYGSLTGFGSHGPLSHKPGYDVMASAMSGLMGITGTPETPVKVGVAITDLSTGLYLHGAIMAALIARSRHGRGQKIDVSLLSSQVSLLANIGQNYLISGTDGRRWGTAHESIVPYQTFAAADGHLIAGALNDRQFQSLCSAMGDEGKRLQSNAGYKTNALRVENRVQLLEELSRIFATKSVGHWIKALEGVSVPCSPVNTLSQAFANPQVVYDGLIQKIQHPTAGQLQVTGPAVKYSDTPATIRTPPPLLGQHTRSILSEVLDMSDVDIDELYAKKVIGINARVQS